MSIAQKRIVLHAFFNDPNKNIVDLVNYIFRAMGFVCLSDAKAILENSDEIIKFGEAKIIIEIIHKNSCLPSVKAIEEIKSDLSRLMPSEIAEKNQKEMSLSKRAYFVVLAYCFETKDSMNILHYNSYNKGIWRAYACLHLFDTLPSEKQKLIVLYALLCVNGRNELSKLQKKVLSNLGYKENADDLETAKKAVLDKIVETNLALSNVLFSSHKIKESCLELMEYQDKEIKNKITGFSRKIADKINDYPTLQTLEAIKGELDEEFPAPISKKKIEEFSESSVKGKITFDFGKISQEKSNKNSNGYNPNTTITTTTIAATATTATTTTTSTTTTCSTAIVTSSKTYNGIKK